MDQKNFANAISSAKIPILVLDQKWHRLFALSGKPDAVKDLEKNVNDALARQGKLTQELKELKKVKNDLMQGIVDNMDESQRDSNKKKEENKRLIEEVNEKMAANEDELMELPKLIADYNKGLMLETMTYCYDRLRVNYNEAEEISEWIKRVRVDLKRNIIKKQNREINNKEIYAYMHDIFGKDIVEMFDVQNSDIEITTGDAIVGDTSDSRQLSQGENFDTDKKEAKDSTENQSDEQLSEQQPNGQDAEEQ
ncbi:MAG: hypothetical protein II472_01865 [Lachnospiraceae bacterium]|nr:hypothetical protein [Lachnospiraceae bacterium]